jgi:hypothetical protein
MMPGLLVAFATLVCTYMHINKATVTRCLPMVMHMLLQ